MVWVFARWIDRRKPGAYGFHFGKEWWADFGVGFLLGAGTLTAVFVTEWRMGWLQVTTTCLMPFRQPCAVVGLIMFIYLLAVGVGEEFTFRGYQIKNVAEGLSGGRSAKWASLLALLATAILFVFAHVLANPNATMLAGINITLAGLLLGLGCLLTGELALPIGLHLAWGYCEGFVYGFPNIGRSSLSSIDCE